MNYAIIVVSGKQYKVSLGDTITVAKLTGNKGDKINIDKVLLFKSKDSLQLGQPYLTDLKVELEITDQKKGVKIDVKKYKQKVRYRKKMGFRPLLTVLKVINLCGEKLTDFKKEVKTPEKTVKEAAVNKKAVMKISVKAKAKVKPKTEK